MIGVRAAAIAALCAASLATAAAEDAAPKPALAIAATAPTEGLQPTGRERTLRVAVTAAAAPLGGVVLSVETSGMEIAPDAAKAGWTLEGATASRALPAIPAGDTRSFELPVRLVHTGADPAQPSSATATAKLADGSAAASFGATVGDCVGAYKAALEALALEALPRLEAALKAARTPDPDAPRASTVALRGKVAPDLAALLRMAQPIAGRRGADPVIASDVLSFQITRTRGALSAYLKQPSNPGLCAPIDLMMKGLRGEVTGVARRADALAKARAEGEAAVAAALERARGATASASAGTAAETGATAAAASADVATTATAGEAHPAPGDGEAGAGLAELLAAAGVEPAQLAELRAAADRRAAVKAALPLVTGKSPAVADPARRAAIAEALAGIEGLAHVEGAAARTAALREAFDALFGGIAGARTASCGCAP